MSDLWGWAELDAGGRIRPIMGYLVGRRQFPPQPEHPGVFFQRFDPEIPDFIYDSDNWVVLFDDYNVWAGWNRNKTLTVVGLTYDTTGQGPWGHTPWFAKVNTQSDILSDWQPDLSDKYDIPATLQVRTQLRFIPGTDNCSFLATDLTHPQPKIFRLNTATMTVDIVSIPMMPALMPVYSYCWSYDGNHIAINAPWVDAPAVRVFTRNGNGDVLAQVSPDDVFGFSVAGFGYTDNSRYMFAWDGSHHVAHDALGSYGLQWSYPMEVVGAGLFGEQVFGISFVTPDPTHSYWFRSGTIALGLGGSNTMSQILDWDGNQIGPLLGGGYSGLVGEWDQRGRVLVTTDGGRDPYGGQVGITQLPTLLGNGDSRQEVGDIRIRPFHGVY